MQKRFWATLALALCFSLSVFSQDLDSVVKDLGTQIDSLKSIELTLSRNDSELTGLRSQLQTLKAELETSKSLSLEQATLLRELTRQLEEFKSARATLSKNLEESLRLSSQYEKKYESTKTLAWILGGLVGGLAVGLAISLVAN